MLIDDLGKLAAWLKQPDHLVDGDPEIAAALIGDLNIIAGVVGESTERETGLVGTALQLWTLCERARGGSSLTEFAKAALEASPNRVQALAALLLTLVGVRDRSKIAATLIRARTAESEAVPIIDLLNLTLAYGARTCRRYADTRYPMFLAALGDFAFLPTLRRNEVEADFAAICAQGAPIDFYTATSATSTGRALLVPHCRAEYMAMGAGQSTAGRSDESPFGMTLRLLPAGRLIGAPAGAGDTVIATYETNAARENVWDIWDYIIGQVFLEFPSADGGRPVETIHATPAFGLILLTKYMLQRGLDPKRSAVRSLFVTGSWIGPTTWRWLEDAWGAKLHTTYSCSELVGAAIECPKAHGRYHFGANLFAEVLDASALPVGHGEQGRIHMSGIYPYQRSAIFLRYEVGDWGRWHTSGACGCGLLGPSIDMLGRTSDVLTITGSDGTRWMIPPIPIRNALDRFNCVPKIPRPQYKISASKDGDITLLRIDVECYALGSAAWQRTTRDSLTEAILEEDPSIRALVEAGEVAIAVRPFSRSRLTNSTSVI
jgi:hypothetical protein